MIKAGMYLYQQVKSLDFDWAPLLLWQTGATPSLLSTRPQSVTSSPTPSQFVITTLTQSKGGGDLNASGEIYYRAIDVLAFMKDKKILSYFKQKSETVAHVPVCGLAVFSVWRFDYSLFYYIMPYGRQDVSLFKLTLAAHESPIKLASHVR